MTRFLFLSTDLISPMVSLSFPAMIATYIQWQKIYEKLTINWISNEASHGNRCLPYRQWQRSRFVLGPWEQPMVPVWTNECSFPVPWIDALVVLQVNGQRLCDGLSDSASINMAVPQATEFIFLKHRSRTDHKNIQHHTILLFLKVILSFKRFILEYDVH
jgi:hypothetical protein